MKHTKNILDLRMVPEDHLLKTMKRYKNLKKQEIQGIFIKTNYRMLAFDMIWLIETLRIYLDDIDKKKITYISNGKLMIIRLILALIKKILLYKRSLFRTMYL